MTRSLMWAVIVTVVAFATPVLAAGNEPVATWGLELRLGQYRPEFGHQTLPGTDKTESDYYKLYFGKSSPIMTALEVDRYLASKVGLLGVYGRVGHWKASGKSKVCQDGGAVVNCTSQTVWSGADGNTTTTFLVVPLTAGVIYRFDLLKKQWDIPLTAYGKAGYNYYLWWWSAAGETTTLNGKAAKGATGGLELSAGLALNLDWIEPSGGRRGAVFLDSNLFVDYTRSWADGFGDRKKINMSADQLTMGLSFDFE